MKNTFPYYQFMSVRNTDPNFHYVNKLVPLDRNCAKCFPVDPINHGDTAIKAEKRNDVLVHIREVPERYINWLSKCSFFYDGSGSFAYQEPVELAELKAIRTYASDKKNDLRFMLYNYSCGRWSKDTTNYHLMKYYNLKKQIASGYILPLIEYAERDFKLHKLIIRIADERINRAT